MSTIVTFTDGTQGIFQLVNDQWFPTLPRGKTVLNVRAGWTSIYA